MHHRLVRLAAVLLPLSLLTAQRTWIVDRAGGPGVDFTDLPAALAAAAPNDLVRVRANPAPYTVGIATRGVTLIADGAAGTGGVVRLDGGLVVRGVPAGEAFAMWGFFCDNTTLPAITIDACPGRVFAEALTVLPGPANPGIVVQRSAAVAIQGCSLSGAPALQITRSHVVAVACVLRGRMSTSNSAPMPACTVDASTLDISEGNWQGGGVPSSPPVPSAPALAIGNGSTVTAAGGFQPVFLTAGFSAVPTAGIEVSLSTLTIDPIVTTGGVHGSTVVIQRIPALRLSSVGRGLPLIAQVRTPVGDVVVLALGFPGLPLPVPPLGDVWLDSTASPLTLFAVQASDVSGYVVAALPLNTPIGLQLALQVLAGSGTAFRLSHPVVAMVR
ncbi:MAG: hypothetical protein IPK26_10690 [Planctomycetes bacterium]|nr:hypothetical protein [Planctomycetota bacterium]